VNSQAVSADSTGMQLDYACAPQLSTRICDFCMQSLFVKAYACHSFVYLKGTAMEHYSREEWTACSECAALIDAEKWNALTERAVRSFVKQHRLSYGDVPAVREQMHYLYSAFRQNMIPES
jgi:hypothetical protein